MIEEYKINAIRKLQNKRKSWLCSDGNLGTVEEVAREYYINNRGFKECLIDSACVYGGLSWLLFHDILFHDNWNARQPLSNLYYYTPQRFYEKYEETIELRFKEFQLDSENVFDRQMQIYKKHPFFCDPQSKIPRHNVEWFVKNEKNLSDFIALSVEHNQVSLIREILIKSYKGRNAGWPDLVAWSETSLVFVEVKSSDKLSNEQRRWMSDHSTYKIELLWVQEEKPEMVAL